MLSKAKGQLLRISAAFNVLFSDTVNEDGKITVSTVPLTISTGSIIAAQNFVDVCCQHAAFVAGRERVDDEISRLSTGTQS